MATSEAPALRIVPLADVLALRPGRCIVTMSPGQWDALLAMAYDMGWTLLEIDADEQPVRAYRKHDEAEAHG